MDAIRPHPHPHSHPGGHPAAPVPPSLLRLSAGQRVAIAAALAALLWTAVYLTIR
jgi:hypothetical protein